VAWIELSTFLGTLYSRSSRVDALKLLVEAAFRSIRRAGESARRSVIRTSVTRSPSLRFEALRQGWDIRLG